MQVNRHTILIKDKGLPRMLNVMRENERAELEMLLSFSCSGEQRPNCGSPIFLSFLSLFIAVYSIEVAVQEASQITRLLELSMLHLTPTQRKPARKRVVVLYSRRKIINIYLVANLFPSFWYPIFICTFGHKIGQGNP